MKKRLGFISNSSTSSFLIYGIAIENDVLIEDYKNNPRIDMDIDIEDEDEIYEYLYEIAEHISTEANLEMYRRYEWEDFCFGLGPLSMNDDETLKEFKDRTKQSLSKIFGSNMEDQIKWIEHCSMDG